ncbi:hypothetical protein DC3_31080 [Deinococcus cellulosilyticus NBRC 106333 = KACC 11606]|uniref:Uncharacterized protein n=1 Tax=Deinococcus cellulosilyticus (strain DSM 18568 / NBRC 106333 / KACC 11606 / 5516J-15) TaxID=1223518 RepID=A0A511N3M8_DEIC1|nr:hypothetical protein DC3_31080 [Deinococcus cellulosilyticus NBRC 106333 = KACC 11606]
MPLMEGAVVLVGLQDVHAYILTTKVLQEWTRAGKSVASRTAWCFPGKIGVRLTPFESGSYLSRKNT